MKNIPIQKPNVRIRTRLNQFGLFAPIYLVMMLGILMTFDGVRPAFIGPGAAILIVLLVSLAPLLYVLAFSPSVDEVATIGDDRITFLKSPTIHFSDVAEYNFDDYLKIKLKGSGFFNTLLFQCSGKNTSGYTEFKRDLDRGINIWKAGRAKAGDEFPRQTFFYGSLRAKFVGWVLLLVYLVLVVFALQIPLPGGYVALIVGGIAITTVSFMLIFGRGKRK